MICFVKSTIPSCNHASVSAAKRPCIAMADQHHRLNTVLALIAAPVYNANPTTTATGAQDLHGAERGKPAP